MQSYRQTKFAERGRAEVCRRVAQRSDSLDSYWRDLVG